MQSISFTGSDFLLEVACPGEPIQLKTFTGQTEIQMPSPSQESWSTATLVPCIPSFSGGFTSPLTLCALCSPATGFFMKSGSIVIFYSSFITQEMIYLHLIDRLIVMIFIHIVKRLKNFVEYNGKGVL
jgi:hypothetical protein